jgi:hypothetical protein
VPALSHAGLVGDADVSLASAAAAGDGRYALDFLAHDFVEDGVGQEDQPVRILWSWPTKTPFSKRRWTISR